jgi:predicted small lipoprotein YifL
MKRLSALLMGIVCILTLTACGDKGGEAAQEKSFPTSTVQAMVEAGAFSEQLEELDAREPKKMGTEAYEAWADEHEELEDAMDEVREFLDEVEE